MGTLYNTGHLFSLCVLWSLSRRPFFFSWPLRNQELCKVWSQSSLIRPKSGTRQELIAWRPVANTKDQTFHLCIFLEKRYGQWRFDGITWLIRVESQMRFEASNYHEKVLTPDQLCRSAADRDLLLVGVKKNFPTRIIHVLDYPHYLISIIQK